MARAPKRVVAKINPPQGANPEATAIALKAAEATGLTPQQLFDLLLESGIAIHPDGESPIIERYSLEDLGKRLWALMQEAPRDKRGDWFHKLADGQKAAIITVLKHRGFSSQTIAHDFNITFKQVEDTWSAYSSQLGAQVLGVRLDTIAGQLQSIYDRCKEMAMLEGDHKGMFKIHQDYVRMLQSLGIVDRAIHRVEVTHKMSDEQAAEIERFVQLEAKKNKRGGEIKLIEEQQSKGDALPKEMDRDLDEASIEDDDER